MIWMYAYGVMAGAVSADATAVKETAEMYEDAMQRSDDSSLESARFLVGSHSRSRTGRIGRAD